MISRQTILNVLVPLWRATKAFWKVVFGLLGFCVVGTTYISIRVIQYTWPMCAVIVCTEWMGIIPDNPHEPNLMTPLVAASSMVAEAWWITVVIYYRKWADEEDTLLERLLEPMMMACFELLPEPDNE